MLKKSETTIEKFILFKKIFFKNFQKLIGVL